MSSNYASYLHRPVQFLITIFTATLEIPSFRILSGETSQDKLMGVRLHADCERARPAKDLARC